MSSQQRGTDALIGVALGAVALANTSVWLGAWSATMVTGSGFNGQWSSGFRVLGSYLSHPGRPPASAWGDPDVPHEVLVYPLTALWAVVLGLVTVAGSRCLMAPVSGFTDRRRLGANAEARFARSRELASLRLRRPVPGRFILGRVGWWTLASVHPRYRNGGLRWWDRLARRIGSRHRAEAFGAVALIGLSQTGKSQHALTALRVLSAAGCPMICSSVKGDIVDQLLAQRRRAGRVGVFDPTGKLRDTYETRRAMGLGVPPGWDERLCVGWSPLDGVSSYDDAVAAAHRLAEAGPGMDKVTSGDFWKDQAEMLIAPLVWIAAQSGRDMGDVTIWVLSEARPTLDDDTAELPEPLLLLQPLLHSPDLATRRDANKVEHILFGLWNKAPATVGSVYATSNTILKPWATEEGRLSSTGQLVNLEWLLAGDGHNTLFISAPPQEQRQLRPVLSGAVSSILDSVFRHVDIHGPIDPPLVVFLDEIGNAPLARLPEYLSTLASSGVLIVTVWQDVAQIKAAYGESYGSILSNSRHVLVFGASKDPATLDWVRQILGEEGADTLSRTSNVGELFGGSVSSSEQRVSLTPANVLREMPKDRALLISANNLPAEVRHIPEHTVRAFEALRRWPYPPGSTLGLPAPTASPSELEVVEPGAVGPAVLLAGAFDSPFLRVVCQLRGVARGWRGWPRRRRPTRAGGGSAGSSPGSSFTAARPDGSGALGAGRATSADGRSAPRPPSADQARDAHNWCGSAVSEATQARSGGRGGGAELVPIDSDGVEDLAGFR